MKQKTATKTEVVDALGADEIRDFERCEKIVEKGKRAFLDVGKALMEIRERRLYRAEYATFEEYCQGRWGWGARHARQLISAVKTTDNLKSGTRVPLLPTTEGQVRPLARLAPEQQREAWQEAVASVPDGKPTVKDVEAAAEKVAPRAKAAAPEPDAVLPPAADGKATHPEPDPEPEPGADVDWDARWKVEEEIIVRRFEGWPGNARFLFASRLSMLSADLEGRCPNVRSTTFTFSKEA